MRYALILLLSIQSFNTFSKSSSDTTLLLRASICGVSIDTNNNNSKIIYWTNIDSNATKFIIYKKESLGTTFDSIDIVKANRYNTYIDNENSWNTNPDYYKMQAVNDSGGKGEISLAEKTTYFEAEEVVDDSVVRLTWTKGNENDSVIIWRRNSSSEYSSIKKISMSDSSFLDTVPFIVWLIEYRLEIIKNETCYSANDTINKARLFANRSSVHFAAVSNTSLQSLQVFPNPVNNSLEFKTNKSLQNVQVSIYNSLGQLKAELIINEDKLNVNNLPEGIYYFTTRIDGILHRGEFVVRK